VLERMAGTWPFFNYTVFVYFDVAKKKKEMKNGSRGNFGMKGEV
jgi:hypothetical protein